MLSPRDPMFAAVMRPNDLGAIELAGDQDIIVLSAVAGVNPRLGRLRRAARERARLLVVDPKTPHFQFEGYMSMPDYRALEYGAGRGTLGRTWQPESFSSVEHRDRLIEQVFEAQRRLEADLLLAPYFYIRDVGHPWVEAAVEVAARALELADGAKVGVPVCIDIDAVLDERSRTRFAGCFADLGASALWLTVVNYDERMADGRDVSAVKHLVSALARGGSPVVLSHVGRTGLLAIAAGAAGYASGVQGLESHPRSFFREMMSSAPTNTYYVSQCMIHLPVRTAQAAFDSSAFSAAARCDCPACRRSGTVTGLVSRRLGWHSLNRRRDEVQQLGAAPPPERMALLRQWLEAALTRCRALGVAKDETNGVSGLPVATGVYHYLEVLLEAAGGPPASLVSEAGDSSAG